MLFLAGVVGHKNTGNLVSFAYITVGGVGIVAGLGPKKEPAGRTGAALLSDRNPNREVGDALGKE